MLAPVPHIYLEKLGHETLGYSNSTTLELSTHLWDIYGTIDRDMMPLNMVKINTPWKPSTPPIASSPK